MSYSDAPLIAFFEKLLSDHGECAPVQLQFLGGGGMNAGRVQHSQEFPGLYQLECDGMGPDRKPLLLHFTFHPSAVACVLRLQDASQKSALSM